MFNTPISQQSSSFTAIYRKGSFPSSEFALTLLGEVLWQIFTLGRVAVASFEHPWHRLGIQASRIQKSTSHSTLSICCAAWMAWLLFHSREGWLTLPEPLILGQLEPREISVKIDHKKCIGDKRLCVFYSFLTSSGWIFFTNGED